MKIWLFGKGGQVGWELQRGLAVITNAWFVPVWRSPT